MTAAVAPAPVEKKEPSSAKKSVDLVKKVEKAVKSTPRQFEAQVQKNKQNKDIPAPVKKAKKPSIIKADIAKPPRPKKVEKISRTLKVTEVLESTQAAPSVALMRPPVRTTGYISQTPAKSIQSPAQQLPANKVEFHQPQTSTQASPGTVSFADIQRRVVEKNAVQRPVYPFPFTR